MLAGNNGVINHAGKAKNQTENAEEKEILEIATLNVIGKNKFGNIEEEKLKEALSNEDVTIKKSGRNFNVTFNKSSRKYKIKSNGDIKYYEEIPATDIYAKLESDGTLKLRATKLDGYEKGTKWNSPDILKVVIEEPIAPKTCYGMFDSCNNLTSFENIENLHTENSTSMYYMFYNCKNLETLDVSNFDTQNVTNMNAMFRSCGNLSNASLNSMLNMCKKATKISDKTLTYVEVPKAKALVCNTLDNYSSFVESGWSIGY